jgi:hypothetical protein
MEKQMTAVEWLINKLNLFNITKEEHYEIFCQIELEAKEMEEEQRVESYKNGYVNGQMDAFTN